MFVYNTTRLYYFSVDCFRFKGYIIHLFNIKALRTTMRICYAANKLFYMLKVRARLHSTYAQRYAQFTELQNSANDTLSPTLSVKSVQPTI